MVHAHCKAMTLIIRKKPSFWFGYDSQCACVFQMNCRKNPDDRNDLFCSLYLIKNSYNDRLCRKTDVGQIRQSAVWSRFIWVMILIRIQSIPAGCVDLRGRIPCVFCDLSLVASIPRPELFSSIFASVAWRPIPQTGHSFILYSRFVLRTASCAIY